jgi:hypothetical protein
MKLLKILWALPLTLFGVFPALAVWLARGHVHCVQGALEVHGPLADWILRHRNLNFTAVAIGHIIIGRDETCCTRARAHEHVHVRQGERWGPFFPFAYCLAGAAQLRRGKHFYWDNPFEREARRADGQIQLRHE